MTPEPTGIEALVCADIAARQQMGVAKYGRSLADAAAAGEDVELHLYQELLDASLYQRAKIEKRKQQPVICPFCGEGDFDLVGLKMHLRFKWCEMFEKTPDDHPAAR